MRKRRCIWRITPVSTVPSPMPASNSAERRRLRVDMGELHAGAIRDHPFLRAGVDEGEVFLAVVVEPEGGPASCPPGAGLGGFRARRGLGTCRAHAPFSWRKRRTRSTVAVVTPLPPRSRPTNLPSLTTIRPNVVSAMPASAAIALDLANQLVAHIHPTSLARRSGPVKRNFPSEGRPHILGYIPHMSRETVRQKTPTSVEWVLSQCRAVGASPARSSEIRVFRAARNRSVSASSSAPSARHRDAVERPRRLAA